MPSSTQALYFHLGMKADDDGFVSPKSVMRMVGAGEDELKVLLAKRFVMQFDSGIFVIKHWRINNNKIQGDSIVHVHSPHQSISLFLRLLLK